MILLVVIRANRELVRALGAVLFEIGNQSLVGPVERRGMRILPTNDSIWPPPCSIEYDARKIEGYRPIRHIHDFTDAKIAANAA